MRYAGIAVGVKVEEGAKENFKYVKRFLETAFKFEEMGVNFEYPAGILLAEVKTYNKNEEEVNGEVVEIKKSKAKEFDIRARYDEEKKEYEFINLDTKLKVKDGGYELYISSLSEIVLIEFFRGLVFKLVVENGGLALHAAAFVSAGKGKVILGRKGAGKSTLLFHNLLDGGNEYNSGDKVVVVEENEKLYAYGFPDYPYFGYGTIRSNEKLKGYFIEKGLPLNGEDSEKVLVDVFSLQEYWGFKINRERYELTDIIIANINKKMKKTESAVVLENIERYNESPYSNWLGKNEGESSKIIGALEEKLEKGKINLELGEI